AGEFYRASGDSYSRTGSRGVARRTEAGAESYHTVWGRDSPTSRARAYSQVTSRDELDHRRSFWCSCQARNETNDLAIQDAEAQHFPTSIASPIIRHLPRYRQPLPVTAVSFNSSHSTRVSGIFTVFPHLGMLTR